MMNADGLVNGRTGIAAAVLLAAVGLGLTSAQTPTMAASTGMSTIAKLAAAGGADALNQMLDARSPGVRAPGALTQTKARRIASLKEFFDPKERVLSKERARPGLTGAGGPGVAYQPGAADGPDLFTPTGPVGLPGGDAVVGNGTDLPPGAGSFPIGGGGPVIIGGGGGGSGGGGAGGGGSGGGGNTAGDGGDTPVVGSAVPEPATWLSLLIGFFGIGFGLRRAAMRTVSRRLHGRFSLP